MIHPAIPGLCPTNLEHTGCSGEGVYGQTFLAEFACTFIFTSVILAFKFDNLTKDHVVAARSIGLTLFTMILVSGGISGGGLNPAIGLVQSIFYHIIVKNYPNSYPYSSSSLNALWIYLVAPTLAGACAGLFSHWNGRVLERMAESPEHKMKDSSVNEDLL